MPWVHPTFSGEEDIKVASTRQYLDPIFICTVSYLERKKHMEGIAPHT